ncbi:tetratricopeptide repeat protein [Acanthopleuribacter pedis]|uniref:Tetratricopeptide repeat protein n=1 Tax=Acanthopleuribacter pedis TaxID=442870 RepID=A0A8J7U2X8_9BACT|nr:tetratricopeptide repeat protein [Acanthopleuribacter pedis]
MFQRILLLAIAALMFVACGGEEERLKIQRDIADLREQIYALEAKQSKSQEEINKLLEELRKQVADRSSQAEVQDQLFSVKDSLATYEARINDLEFKLTQIRRASTDVVTNPVNPVNPDGTMPNGTLPDGSVDPSQPAGEVVPGEDLEAVFNQARLDLDRGKFDVAIDAFKEITEQFSASPFAESAQYYLGRAYFDKKQWADAITSFDTVITKYGGGTYVRQAMYYLGQCYYYRNSHSKAILQLQELIEKHPGTQESELAKQFLKRAGYQK